MLVCVAPKKTQDGMHPIHRDPLSGSPGVSEHPLGAGGQGRPVLAQGCSRPHPATSEGSAHRGQRGWHSLPQGRARLSRRRPAFPPCPAPQEGLTPARCAPDLSLSSARPEVYRFLLLQAPSPKCCWFILCVPGAGRPRPQGCAGLMSSEAVNE